MYLNDQSLDAPKLRIYLNSGNLTGLPASSRWPGLTGEAAVDQLRRDGFEGLQLDGGETGIPVSERFPACGLDRINHPEECDTIFARHKGQGESCITLHVGWGLEDDDAVDALLRSILDAIQVHQFPAFIETHRATITQDMWRLVGMTRRFPEIRFNGDFSHLYCGQEMVYGDFEAKLDFLQPVFERIGFLHGRIAAPGFMQAPIETLSEKPRAAVGVDYLEHFREMWIRSMEGFLSHAGRGDVLVFAPELLRPEIYYARVFPDAGGRLREETDRYAQALLYRDLARECFARARDRSSPGK
jgi:hypothetical protein